MAAKDATEGKTQTPKPKPLTLAQAKAVMEKNKTAYTKYQVKRGEGVKRDANPHRKGYQAYKSAYRRVLELTKDEREAAKAERQRLAEQKAKEAEAKAKAEAKAAAKAEREAAKQGAGEPVESPEGTPEA